MPEYEKALWFYCERPGDLHWFTEPFGFLSNLAYLISAYLLFRHYKQTVSTRHYGIEALIFLVLSIGIGSGLWHSIATEWAMYLDLWPILIAVLTCFWQFQVLVLKWQRKWAWLFIIALIPVAQVNKAIGGAALWHGTGMYLTPYFALLGLLIVAIRKKETDVRYTGSVMGILTAAMLARALDQPLCDMLPWGTHWLWHIFTAALLHKVPSLLITYAGKAK